MRTVKSTSKKVLINRAKNNSRARIQTDTLNVPYPNKEHADSIKSGREVIETKDNIKLILSKKLEDKKTLSAAMEERLSAYPLLKEFAQQKQRDIAKFWDSGTLSGGTKDRTKALSSNLRFDSGSKEYNSIALGEGAQNIVSSLMGLTDSLIQCDAYHFNRYGPLFNSSLVKARIKEFLPKGKKKKTTWADLPEYDTMDELHKALITDKARDTVIDLLTMSAKKNWGIVLTTEKLGYVLEQLLEATTKHKVFMAPHYGLTLKNSYISETKSIYSQEGHKNIILQITLAATAHLVREHTPIMMRNIAEKVGSGDATVTRAVDRSVYFNTASDSRNKSGSPFNIIGMRGRGLVSRVAYTPDTRSKIVLPTLQGLNVIWSLAADALETAALLK